MPVAVARLAERISRFITVPFESMARGVPFVFHNPHRETVASFKTAMDAFVETRPTSEVAERLTEVTPVGRNVREQATPFMKHHVDIVEVNSETRGTHAIISELA